MLAHAPRVRDGRRGMADGRGVSFFNPTLPFLHTLRACLSAIARRYPMLAHAPRVIHYHYAPAAQVLAL